jgi:L-alanine-DL-glutamate epimerase-like enolase superfamily enzyme
LRLPGRPFDKRDTRRERQTSAVATYDAIRDLSLVLEDYALEGLEQQVSSDFVRRTTVIRLRGGGHEGVGEDVTYDGDDQLALQAEGPTLPLAGEHTIESFSRLLEALNLWPAGPSREDYRNYRRWAYESAALDLALRQAGRSIAEAFGRETRPVTYVVSMRFPDPPTTEKVRRLLEHYPGLRFKLDAVSSWTDELVAELADLGVVDSIDLKGAYSGTVVDQPPDPALYARIANGFPDAWIEDPALTPETEPVLARAHDRITWDAPIHSVGDIDALPFPPRTVNIKPSRFGSWRALCEAYDACTERGMGAYGGGQFELGPGRGQIQLLASLFHPDGPNDTAPREFNLPDPPAGLPASPMPARPSATGFRWEEDGSGA